MVPEPELNWPIAPFPPPLLLLLLWELGFVAGSVCGPAAVAGEEWSALCEAVPCVCLRAAVATLLQALYASSRSSLRVV
jgi:hypothetical protein